MRRVLVTLIILILTTLPALAKDSELLTKSGKAVIGKTAPWISGWTIDGKVFNIKKAFEKAGTKKLALVFWATWCDPCREGMRKLNAAKSRLKAAGVSVVLINVDDTSEAPRKFLKRNPVKFPVVLDPYLRSKAPFLAAKNGSILLPRTVIIKRGGKVERIIGEEGKDYIDRIVQ